MLMFRLPRFVAGLGYAGACRPLYRTGLLRHCRVGLKKLRDPVILSKWRHLLVPQTRLQACHNLKTSLWNLLIPSSRSNTLKMRLTTLLTRWREPGGSTMLWLWTRLEVVGLFFLN